MSLRSATLTVLFASVISCSSLPVTRAVWSGDPQEVPQGAWTRDMDSGLDWVAANDADVLFIGVRIKDRMRQNLARRGGVKIYMDPTGSTSDDIMVQYPFVPEPIGGDPGFSRYPVSTDLLWRREETQVILNPQLERTAFKAQIRMDDEGTMTCILGVPLDSLQLGRKGKVVQVSIGIDFFWTERRGGERESGGLRAGSMGPPPGGRSRPGGGISGEGRPGGERAERPRATRPVWFIAKVASPPAESETRHEKD